jgi:flagellar basal body rod protein FlgC
MNGINVSQSGLAAAATTLDVSAHNTANALTPNFNPLRADAAEVAGGGVRVSISKDARTLEKASADAPSRTDLVSETATRISASAAYRANLKTIETMDDVSGVLVHLGARSEQP